MEKDMPEKAIPSYEILLDENGREVFCKYCHMRKLKEKCNEIEFSCGGEDYACEGWYGACCKCGYDYGIGQM